MAKLTIENCKAPRWDSFDKLRKIKADVVFEEAAGIKREIALLEDRLAKLKPRIQAKLDLGLDDDTTSVLYGDLLMTRRAGYTQRRLDTKWAVKKLIAKGVKKAEIEANTTEMEIEPTVSIRLLGSDDGDEG